jgi:glycosyltransferase involved in cell wall biosynthesis
VLFAVPEFPPPVVGGLERQAAELARALAGRGVEVTVLTKRFAAGQGAEEHDGGVRVIRIPAAGPVREAAALARQMARLRGRYDVVHLHNVSWFGVPVILAARLLGRPVLSKLPNFGTWGIPGQVARRFGSLWLAAFRRSDAVVALSAESLAELAGVSYPDARVLRVTNGVRTDLFRPGPPSSHGRVEVVFVGRLDPAKGLADLLAAWPHVARTVPGAALRIFGQGPMREELAETVERLGSAESVRLEGHATDVAGVLAAADVFVLPSYAEGNSNAVLEAMAAGLPVVSTHAGGTPLLVGPQGRRWLVQPGDRDGLGEALVALASDHALREEVGRAMRDRAVRVFSIAAVAELYERTYRLLAAGARDRVATVRSAAWHEPGSPP